ncbi:MAG: hypothetical protein ACOYNL_10045 [Rickettsiales bacterium]
MGISAQMNATTVLSPRERERKKSAQQRAEDVIYTLNHTITCIGLTDFLIMPALRGLGVNIGHTHGAHETAGNHAHGHGHDHGHHNHGAHADCGHAGHAHSSAAVPFWKRVWRSAGHWFVGEGVGDVGAAFVTICVQRFAPSVMDAIRGVIEPVAGNFFRRGATRAAHKWADRHGLAYDSQEVVDRAQELYRYEMQHLPQMAVWTASSIALHYAVMRKFEKMSVVEFGKQKAAGAGITAAIVFGARALAPDKAHRWDETAGKKVVMPLTKKFGKLFGIDERDVDEYHARMGDQAPRNWAQRVRADALANPEPTASRSA